MLVQVMKIGSSNPKMSFHKKPGKKELNHFWKILPNSIIMKLSELYMTKIAKLHSSHGYQMFSKYC